MRRLYLDSSAIVKLVVREQETHALGEFLRAEPSIAATSQLARVEVVRAAKASGISDLESVRRMLEQFDEIPMTTGLLDSAASLADQALRSLDAIHLASALTLAAHRMVAYDHRLLAAAEQAGLDIASPGA